MKMGEMFNHKG